MMRMRFFLLSAAALFPVAGLAQLVPAPTPPGPGLASTGSTLSVVYGTTAGTAAQGNDNRIVGAVQAKNNLSDLASAAAARSNLGVGSIAMQSAGAVAVTGGSVAGADVSGANVTAAGGTTARTPAARAGDVFNALDNGAKGDCTTDDAPALNALIARIAATTSMQGEIYFPQPPGGCYLVKSPLALPAKTTGLYDASILLIGNGENVSIIRAGQTGMAAVVETPTAWNRGHGARDITFDAAGLATYAVWTRGGAESHWTRIQAMNGTTADFEMDGGESFVTDSLLWNQSNVFTNSATQSAYNLNVTGADNHFTQNVMWNALTADISDSGADNHFVENHGYGYPSTYAPQYNFVANGASVWTGNTADTATVAGFNVTAYNAQVIGNIIQGGPVAIHIAAGVGGAVVEGNSVHSSYTAANIVVQDASPGANTLVYGNAGASYENMGQILAGYGQTVASNAHGYVGSYGSVYGKNSFGWGDNVNDSYRTGVMTHGNGAFAWSGDAQWVDYTLRAETSTTTPITLIAGGTNGPTANTTLYNVDILLMRTDIPFAAKFNIWLTAACNTGDAASWEGTFTGNANKSVASVDFVDASGGDSTPTLTRTAYTSGASAWAPTITKDNTLGGFRLNGAGACTGGKTVYWVAHVHAVEAGAAN
jgi:hypothetical protein